MSTSEGINDARLGPLLRMRAIPVSQLPAHPNLEGQQTDTRPVVDFATAALDEAHFFMTAYLPDRFTVKDTGKKSEPATARVALSSHDIKAGDFPAQIKNAGAEGMGDENWFARTSIHDNAAREGTASWEEFDHGLRVDHSQHEKDYTPDVYDAHEVMNWDHDLEKIQRKIGAWEDVHVSVMEMVHHIQNPVNDRVFPVLVITAKKSTEFLVVQIPVATQGLPNAKYHDVPKITGGIYVSIERGELVEGGSKVQWQMATASNAKGSLPMFAQKLGIPGAVVKDVGLFIDWCSKRRTGRHV